MHPVIRLLSLVGCFLGKQLIVVALLRFARCLLVDPYKKVCSLCNNRHSMFTVYGCLKSPAFSRSRLLFLTDFVCRVPRKKRGPVCLHNHSLIRNDSVCPLTVGTFYYRPHSVGGNAIASVRPSVCFHSVSGADWP